MKRMTIALALALLAAGCGLFGPEPVGHGHVHVHFDLCRLDTDLCSPPNVYGLLFNSVDVRLVGTATEMATTMSVRTSGVGGFDFADVPIGQYSVEIDARPDPQYRIDFHQSTAVVTENSVTSVSFVGTLSAR